MKRFLIFYDARRIASFLLAAAFGGLILRCEAAGATGNPGFSSSSASDISSDRRRKSSRASEVYNAARKEVRVPIKFRNGVPLISCRANGREVWMILDTGSQECVVESETAVQCGVSLSHDSRGPINLTGAGGTEKVLIGSFDALGIGAWHLHNIPCIIRTRTTKVPGSGLFSRRRLLFNILGIRALRANCSYVTLDYARRVAVFGFGKIFQPENTTNGGPIVFEQDLPHLKVSCGESEWSALLDTGCSPQMEMNQDSAEALGLNQRAEPSHTAQIGLGSSSGMAPRESRRVLMHGVSISGRLLRNINMLIVPDRSKVGNGLLCLFRTTLDFQRSMLWLE